MSITLAGSQAFGESPDCLSFPSQSHRDAGIIDTEVTCLFFGVFVLFVLFFSRQVSLCSFGVCAGTHSVDQAGLELTESSASASRVLGLKMCTTTILLRTVLLNYEPI